MTSTMFHIGGDLGVRRLGFGAMRLPTEAGPAREASLAVARRAVELGVTLIDTAHMYGWGANEELLAEALYPYADGLLITTEVGVARSPSSAGWELDARPDVLRAQVDHTLRRLRVERIDLLQLHRIDPEVPLAEQLGALRELQTEGKVGRIGLSEVTVAELERAREIVDVASVQNRYSLLDREHEPVLATCEAAGIAFLPWRPVAGAASAASAEIAAVAAELDATRLKSRSRGSFTTPRSSSRFRARLGSATWRRTSLRRSSASTRPASTASTGWPGRRDFRPVRSGGRGGGWRRRGRLGRRRRRQRIARSPARRP